MSVTYRMDGSLLDLQALAKTQDRLITGYLLVNDAALIAHTEQASRSITSCFADASRLFGLDVSLRKTEVFHQPILPEELRPPRVTIGDVELISTQ